MRNGMEVFIPFVSSYLNVTPPVLSIDFFEGVETQQTHLQKKKKDCFFNIL